MVMIANSANSVYVMYVTIGGVVSKEASSVAVISS